MKKDLLKIAKNAIDGKHVFMKDMEITENNEHYFVIKFTDGEYVGSQFVIANIDGFVAIRLGINKMPLDVYENEMKFLKSVGMIA